MTDDPFRKPRNPDWTLEGHRKPRDIGPKLLAIALAVVAVAAAVIFAAVKWAPGLAKLIAPAPSTVEAPQLSADYAADEAAARTYRTRPLTVTGNVIFRGKFANEETIQLSGSEALRPVFITFIFGDIPANYHSIEVGQHIAATCDRVETIAGAVALDTCTLKVLPPQ